MALTCELKPIEAFLSTNINTKQDSYDALTDRILYSLGAPMVNVELFRDQIYANITTVEQILNDQGDDNSKLVATNGLNAVFYLYNNDDLEQFEKEVQDKGLSTYYSVTTNEDEISQQLQPI